MSIKRKALLITASLALSAFVTKLATADEWNKKTEFQFSAPVQIPGQVLAPGKYVFELADSSSDRNIVQVFSEDSNGKENLLATILAVPDYMTQTPDKPIIHFEERHSGTPEAVHSWFYPGDNTGWQFVYPRGQGLEESANSTPAPAPVAAAATPSLPSAPQVQEEEEPASEVASVEEEILVAQNDTPAPSSDYQAPAAAQGSDAQNTADRELPQTGGYSELQLMTGLAMLGGGLAAVLASRRKSVA
jgi:LPXTG-motif cell wall-anchored protein